MKYYELLKKTLTVLMVVVTLFVCASAIGGMLLGQPLGFSYASSGSMSPTIETGDVVFLVPKPFFEPEVGDVVVFKLSGTFFMHRLIAKTSDGFVTCGDASLFSDQHGGFPYITEEMIVGEVFSVWSTPILIPKAGLFIEGLIDLVSSYPLIFGAGFVAVIGVPLVFDHKQYKLKIKKKHKSLLSPNRFKHNIFALLFLLILVSSILMVFGSNYFQIKYATFDDKTTTEDVTAGQSFERQLYLDNNGVLPYLVFVETNSANINIQKQEYLVWPGETKNVSFSVTTIKEAGWHSEELTAWKYLPFLPVSLTVSLVNYSPYFPIIVIDLELIAVAVLLFFLVGKQSAPVKPQIGLLKQLRRNLRRVKL